MTDSTEKKSGSHYRPSAIRRMARARKSRRDREEERKKNRELEIRVKLATRELKRTNKQLQQEISERKQAEEELRKSEEKYRAIFESFYDIYYRADMEGKITAISPSVREHGGYEPEELIGCLATDFYPDPSQREELLKRLREKGAVNDFEIKMRTKDGTILDIWVSTHLVFDRDGNPIAVEGVLRNITDRKQVEEELRRSEEKYRSILEAFYDVYYSANMEGVVTAISSSVEAQTGYSPEEIIGRPVVDFYPDPNEREELLKILREKGGVNDYEIHMRSKDSGVLDVLVSTHLIFDQDGNPIAVEGVLRNITERKQSQEELQESEARYRSLFENAHDAIFLLKGGRFVEWNYQTLQMLGCTEEEIGREEIYRFFLPRQPDGSGSKETALEKFNAALSGKTQFFIWKLVRQNGKPFDAEISLCRLPVGGDTLIQAIVRDLSAVRKKAVKLRRGRWPRFLRD